MANSSINVKISQASLNLVRQFVAATGWAKEIPEIYLGGKLLTEGFPELDPIDWVKTQAQTAALTDEERVVYLATDKAWSEKTYEFTITEKEQAVIKKAFGHVLAQPDNRLGPSPYINEIIDSLGLI